MSIIAKPMVLYFFPLPCITSFKQLIYTGTANTMEDEITLMDNRTRNNHGSICDLFANVLRKSKYA